jgi:hypothetical protein
MVWRILNSHDHYIYRKAPSDENGHGTTIVKKEQKYQVGTVVNT